MNSTTLESLRAMTIDMKDCKKRQNVEKNTLDEVVDTLEMACSINGEEPQNLDTEVNFTVMTECYRVLRNSCAGCPDNQDIIFRHGKLLEVSKHLIVSSIDKHRNSSETKLNSKSEEGACVSCCLQCMVNSVQGNGKNQLLVWSSISNTFRLLLEIGDNTICDYTCCLVYCCIPALEITLLLGDKDFLELIESVLEHLSNCDTQWALFLFQSLFSCENFLERVYDEFLSAKRIILLNLMDGLLHNQKDEEKSKVQVKNVCYISRLFREKAYILLGLSNSSDVTDMEPLAVLKYIDIICEATSIEEYTDLKNDSELLKCTINLLHSIKVIGHEGDNAFTDKSKANDQHGNDVHPVFGLKTNLIKLIGNMSYKHRQNQDLIREQGGIQLILNSTNIDTRNPYITQWAVFAVRNICENNKENQAVIAGLSLEGMADNVQLLKDFGVNAQLENGKIVVRDLNS